MSNRRQLNVEVGQMGEVWIASMPLSGISAIGASEVDAIDAVWDAWKTHNMMGIRRASSPDCDSCS
jgi:hypothetical protein